jgi:hypothetical protein
LKTTELVAEQVLIGLLVISIVALVAYDPENPIIILNNKSSVDLILTGGLLIGAAYLIGMVYDRMADTLLQDIESHGRLQFALRSFKIKDCGTDRYTVPTADPFEEGKYRILVLDNSQATDHMEYLRSRIRLTRALATLIPGIMVSLLLAMDWGRASAAWKAVAITVPLVYAVVFFLKVMKRKELFKRPPKTYQLEEVRKYMYRARMLRDNSSPPRHVLWLLFQDEVWIGLLILAIAASILVLSTRSYDRLSIAFLGLALTIVVGWSWWRICGTFYAFLRDYNRYGLKPPPA